MNLPKTEKAKRNLMKQLQLNQEALVRKQKNLETRLEQINLKEQNLKETKIETEKQLRSLKIEFQEQDSFALKINSLDFPEPVKIQETLGSDESHQFQ